MTEQAVGEVSQSQLRHGERHNHIGIRLQYRADNQWVHLQALGWNAVGFNFHHATAIDASVLQLKRGLTRFEGTIVWRSRTQSDDIVTSTVVNELIFQRTQAVDNNPALQSRLIRLIRVSGMVPEKLKILASMGQAVSNVDLAERVAQRKREGPMFHYGVQVESDAWVGVVNNAYDISSVVISMEKWSDAFAQK